MSGGSVRDRWWLLAVVATVMATGVALKVSCLGPDGLTLAETAIPWCYSDVVGIYQGRGLGEGLLPYREALTEYPPLTALQWWVAGGLSTSVTGFYLVTAVIQGIAAVVVVAVLVASGVSSSRVLVVTVAPALLLVGTVNWDLVAVALLVAGLLVAQVDTGGGTPEAAARVTGRSSPGRWAAVASGVLLGLGGLAKVFPLLAVPVLTWSAIRTGRRRWAVAHAVAATATVLVVQVPVALWAPGGWAAWIRVQRDRPVDWDTLWYALQVVIGRPLDPWVADGLILAVSALGVGVAVLLGRRWPAGSEWRLLLPLLAWFLVVGKVYSPQYSLWLLPLLALSRTPLPLVGAWLVADAAVVLTRFPFLAGQQEVGPWTPYWPFGVAVVVRAVLLLLIIAAVTRPDPKGTTPLPHACVG